MTMHCEYKFIGFGATSVHIFPCATIDAVIEYAQGQGVNLLGFEDHPQRRAELQGQPRFHGFLGPMYDGENSLGQPIIRYEDQSSYDVLST